MENQTKLRKFLESGSEIAGSVSGTAAGLIIAGPMGALAGAALGPIASKVIARTCLEIHDRVLGNRERVRAGATAAFAIACIEERLKQGEQIRDDDFFDADTDRSSADEILEGVMLKSRNDHQEKKARFYANILVNSSFDNKLSLGTINHALTLAERITYRQLCLLQLFSEPQPIFLRDGNYRNINPEEISNETRALIAEVYGMYQDNLILYRRKEGELMRANFNIESIHPSKMRRTALGERIHRLMGLEGILYNDLAEVAALLQ